MTLSTDIYITGTGATMRQVYDKVNDLLGIPQTRLSTETSTSIRNRIGQGFPAIVAVSAGEGGSLVTPQHDDDCELEDEPCTYYGHTEQHHVHVNLDTGYAYRDERGWDCSRLHAYVILALADWLSDKDCSVRWTNEYAGTTHDTSDVDAVERFIGGGDDIATIAAALVIAAVPTAAYAAIQAAPRPLKPCATEGAQGPCVWDATHMGNGEGTSFIVLPPTANYPDGRVVYLSHREAHDLLNWN